MLLQWKKLLILKNTTKKVFFVHQHNFHSYKAALPKSKTQTFKERSLLFFETNVKYRDLFHPSNKVLQSLHPISNTLLPQQSDFSVQNAAKTWGENFIPTDSIDQQQFKKDVFNLLCQSTGRESIFLANIVFQLIEENFVNEKFYQELYAKAKKSIEICSTNEELVVWAYLCSLNRTRQSNVSCLRAVYERYKKDLVSFQNLSIFEMSIVCNAWFSINIIVSSKPILRIIEQNLLKEIGSSPDIISQESLSMLKVLRKAGFGTDHLFDSLLSSLSSPNARSLNLAQATHVLALLADHRCLLSENCVQNIVHLIATNAKRPIQMSQKFVHPSKGTRIKDLTRFMWSASCLIPTEVSSREKIALKIIEQVNTSWSGDGFQLEKDCHLLSDFFLSLACWQIYPKSLIESVINQNFIECVIKQKQTVRQSRLALFLVSAQIEAPYLAVDRSLLPQVAFNLPPYRVEKELSKRPYLSRFAAFIDRKREQLGWENIHCFSTIPHLNFAGITFDFQGQKVAVEVLDQYVCMRHSNIPERLLALKIRLSKQLGYRVIQLDFQKPSRKLLEAEVQDDNFIDQQLTKIQNCLENDYV